MARYNTVTTTNLTTGGTTFATPAQGLLTTFTGTAPYTVNLASPGLYTGLAQSFYNATSGVVTIATPSGNIIGPGFTAGSSQPIPANASYTLTSDGINYVITNNEGGPQLGSTGNFTDTLTANKATGTGLSVTANSTFGGTVTMNGSAITASASFTPTNTYDLMTKTFVELKYGKPWSTITSATNATAGDRYFCNTNGGGFTVTLPASPDTGDMIHLIDVAGTFSSNNLTVGNNGNRIMRQLDTMTVSTNGAAFTLIWSGNASFGWVIAQGI